MAFGVRGFALQPRSLRVSQACVMLCCSGDQGLRLCPDLQPTQQFTLPVGVGVGLYFQVHLHRVAPCLGRVSPARISGESSASINDFPRFFRAFSKQSSRGGIALIISRPHKFSRVVGKVRPHINNPASQIPAKLRLESWLVKQPPAHPTDFTSLSLPSLPPALHPLHQQQRPACRSHRPRHLP